MWHQQNQDTTGYSVRHVQYLWAKHFDARKQQTRIIPQDDEETQDGSQRDRKHKHSQENQLHTYPT